jgi:SH3 domain-containing YSC84-like protein 1
MGDGSHIYPENMEQVNKTVTAVNETVNSTLSKVGVNTPLPTALVEECKKCAAIIDKFTKPEDGKIKELSTNAQVGKYIPVDLIKNAKGIAIVTVMKAGFVVTGRAGSGLVMSRLENGEWSAPSAIGLGGMGIGWQFGAEFVDFVFVLNTQEAVDAFYKPNVTLGGSVSVAAGPYGRTAEVSGEVSSKFAPIYSYSNSQGFFAGVSLEGTVIVARDEANEQFYGEKVSAKEILSGFVSRPDSAKPLYDAIKNHLG